MRFHWRVFPVLLLALSLACGAAQAADALDRAIAHAEALQTRALGSVAAAERALADAQADLRVVRGIEADARRVRDSATITVAAEAAQQAQALERDTQRNLNLARAILDTRSRQLHDLRSWTRADRRPRAVVVVESGEVRHHAQGGYIPRDMAPVQAGERIETGPGARARLFVSGGDAEVALGANSSYTVTQDDAAGNFVAQLETGLMRLRGLVKAKLGRKFEVRTPSIAIAVRGTDFSVARTPAGDRVQVYSGVVAVTPVAGGAERLLQAGEALEVPAQGPWPSAQRFEPGLAELAW
jgi:ferric-dicitrate binding protein FerR (iron transport regulator)